MPDAMLTWAESSPTNLMIFWMLAMSIVGLTFLGCVAIVERWVK